MPKIEAALTTAAATTRSTSNDNAPPSAFRMGSSNGGGDIADKDQSTNLFANKPTQSTWPITAAATLDASTNNTKLKVTASNGLIENSTFGSAVSAKATSQKSNKDSSAAAAEEISRLRVRKKDKLPAATSAIGTTQPLESSTTVTTTGPPVLLASTVPISSEATKRQRIDLKGPRVKHVCRSAQIVLGQPLATFPDESNVLSQMDTPPRPDSPAAAAANVTTKAAAAEEILHPTDDETHSHESCQDCTTVAPLSPPTTPIASADVTDEPVAAPPPPIEPPRKQIEAKPVIIAQPSPPPPTVVVESLKPITRKLGRPNLLTNKILGTTNKKLNSFSRPIRSAAAVPQQQAPPLISIDFWENYDPAEVSQSGFGLIVSEAVPLRALCFLCGSSGKDPLRFCVCCCEPYHQYCVEDEYNIKAVTMTSQSLDDTNVSIMDASAAATDNRLHWLCPRCTVCYTCNMASGSKVKCQKCQKNYHSTCLGTSKRLLGADRPLICAGCLKCKSCGTTNVSKFVGNLPMCSACFRLRQKGNFCPLCQKCYEDNDFNIKMMECGDCRRWVHAKCEGLTDEQYNMLSVLPENIEFICKKCAKCNASAATQWRDAVTAEFRSGMYTFFFI